MNIIKKRLIKAELQFDQPYFDDCLKEAKDRVDEAIDNLVTGESDVSIEWKDYNTSTGPEILIDYAQLNSDGLAQLGISMPDIESKFEEYPNAESFFGAGYQSWDEVAVQNVGFHYESGNKCIIYLLFETDGSTYEQIKHNHNLTDEDKEFFDTFDKFTTNWFNSISSQLENNMTKFFKELESKNTLSYSEFEYEDDNEEE